MKRIASVATALLLVLGLAACAETSPSEVCRVSDKDRSAGSNGTSSYRVYTSCGVFTVSDDLFHRQYNAADTYAAIRVGREYRLTTYGPRNGFLSIFPNIIKAEEVASK